MTWKLNAITLKRRELWSGLLFLVTGAAFAIGATNYNLGSSARPGPGYFPLGLGVLLAMLGAVAVFRALSTAYPTTAVDDDGLIGPWAFRPLIWISLSAAAFGWALPRLGFVIALPIAVVVAAMAGTEFTWKEAIASAVVLTVGSWLVFIVGLGLFIPLWPAF